MNAKDKMNKKNKQGAAFTDDGFAMGRPLHSQFHDTRYCSYTNQAQKKITIPLFLKYTQSSNVVISLVHSKHWCFALASCLQVWHTF